MKKYKEELIDTIKITDIDLESPFYEDNSEEPNEIEYDENISSDTVSISIEDLRGFLNYLDAKNANRIYINVDTDHHGYQFIGVNFKEIE